MLATFIAQGFCTAQVSQLLDVLTFAAQEGGGHKRAEFLLKAMVPR